MYRAAALVARLGPREVDDLELWELAAVLGRNEAEQREPWPEDAPPIGTFRRLNAYRNDRVPPAADDPISDDEYRELVALAKTGQRTATG